mmetsp:Transcript_52564/g.170823  ORF Transcript_52564/g.170823 Transcript_52564/m.170823 type:complete len:251 (+) Transcript_52564:2891-3643(+)
MSLCDTGSSLGRRFPPRFVAWCRAVFWVSSRMLIPTSFLSSKNSTMDLWPSPAAYMSAVLPRMSPQFRSTLLDEEDENQPSFSSQTFLRACTSPATAASNKHLIFMNLGMKTTPSWPRLFSDASPTATLPSAATRESHPVTMRADILTRYLSIGQSSSTEKTVPGLSLALTSLAELASVCTASMTLASYLVPTAGSFKSQCTEAAAADCFRTRGSLSLVALLIQPSSEPALTLARRPDTSKICRRVPAGS